MRSREANFLCRAGDHRVANFGIWEHCDISDNEICRGGMVAVSARHCAGHTQGCGSAAHRPRAESVAVGGARECV